MKREKIARSNKSFYIGAILIVLAVVLSYSPVYHSDFVNLDDHQYIQKNEDIREPGIDGVLKLFYAPHSDMYIPLVYLSYSVEYTFTELAPQLYHIDNVILHIINSLLVLWLVALLIGNNFVSICIAGLFALHPFHVESVAWLSERKDVLYALFFLLAVICYHFYAREKQMKFYLLSIAFFLLSCLSKPMAITLPFVLLLYDYYYLHNRKKQILVDKLPFFIISVIISVITIRLMGTSLNAHPFNANYSLLDKSIMLLYSIYFYMQKTILPFHLSAIYTYPVKVNSVIPIRYVIDALVAAIILCFVFFSKRINEIIKVCFLFFLITVSPVLQFLANTYSFAADRYSYVPLLGFLGIIAYGFHYVARRKWINEQTSWVVLCSILLLSSIISYQRSKVWENDLSLYSDIIAKEQYTEAAFCSLADAYTDRGGNIKALQIILKADSLYTNSFPVIVRYAAILAAIGQYDNAILQYQRCMQLGVKEAGLYINLGDAYLKIGRNEDAFNVLLKGHELFPCDKTCLYNLGYTCWLMNNKEDAAKYFKIAAADNFQPAIDFINKHGIR